MAMMMKDAGVAIDDKGQREDTAAFFSSGGSGENGGGMCAGCKKGIIKIYI